MAEILCQFDSGDLKEMGQDGSETGRVTVFINLTMDVWLMNEGKETLYRVDWIISEQGEWMFRNGSQINYRHPSNIPDQNLGNRIKEAYFAYQLENSILAQE